MLDIEAVKVCAKALHRALDVAGVVPDAEMLVEFLSLLDEAGWQIARKLTEDPKRLPVPGVVPAAPAPIASSSDAPVMTSGTEEAAPGLPNVDDIPF